MSKSHKEVISHLQAQGVTLLQVVSSFPAQAAQVQAVVENIRTIESCLQKAAQATETIHLGITELQEMKKGE